MPKCPSCNLEIDHVIGETDETRRSLIRLPRDLKEQTTTEYDPDSGLMWLDIPDNVICADRYICPECRKEIFADDDKVEGNIMNFLKGG